MIIDTRPERGEDAHIIRQVTNAAFGRTTEGAIVDALREAGVLTLSLVATIDNEVVGHVAFSPVKIDGQDLGWFGLGPVSVRPDLHGNKIGSRLVQDGLERLKETGAQGCVVLGEPSFYRRFGFESDPGLVYEDAPAIYFLSLPFAMAKPSGIVTYSEGFAAS